MFRNRALRCFLVVTCLIGAVIEPARNSIAQNPFRKLICGRTTVEELARCIDHLEKQIEEYGSVVAKNPDVWGEERLTLHRFEYEQQLRAELTNFHGTINAQISRSDQAFLASALAVSSALGPGGTPQTTNRAVGLLTASTSSTSILPADNFVRPTAGSPANFASVVADSRKSDGKSVALEPTLFLDQMSRYLNHLHELRRINEGDDLKDLPGYTLHMLRMPVSILPGKKTRQGFGAQITVTATPQLGDELLPLTFKDWVINDLVYQNGLALFDLLNSWTICGKTKVERADGTIASIRPQVDLLKAILATIGELETTEYGTRRYRYSLAENGWWTFSKNPEAESRQQKFFDSLGLRLLSSPWVQNSIRSEFIRLGYGNLAKILSNPDIDVLIANPEFIKVLVKTDVGAVLNQSAVPGESLSNLIKIINLARDNQKIKELYNLENSVYSKQMRISTLLDKIDRLMDKSDIKKQIDRMDVFNILLSSNVRSTLYDFDQLLKSFRELIEIPAVEAITFEEFKSQPDSNNSISSASDSKKMMIELRNSLAKADELVASCQLLIDDPEVASVLMNPGVRKLLSNQDVKESLINSDIKSAFGKSELLRSIYPFASSELNLTAKVTEFRKELWRSVDCASIKLSSNVSRNAQMSFPLSQFSTVYGQGMMLCVGLDAFDRISRDRDTDLVQFQEIEGYLREEISAAFELLQRPENHMLWEYANQELVTAIRRRDRDSVEAIRIQFFEQLENTLNMPQHDGGEAPAGCFAWAIIVEATLLNERLNEDLRAVASSKGCACLPTCWQQFHVPNPTPEARSLFNQYVQCRWPIHTFHLDPLTQDQNVGDKFSSTRELQLSMAVAVATGQIGVDQATKFARRIQLDLETIALNRTVVGFSHGEETFGWRFYPRVQTPPIESNSKVIFRDLLRGGPSNDALLRLRQIEPGARECIALVVAPAFLRQLILDVNGDWQGLTNSKKGKPSNETAVRLGREIQCIRELANACEVDAHLHRDGEVHRLLLRARQLEQVLPLQTLRAEVPVMSDLGGFRLLVPSGNINKSPQLFGWTGRPGYVRGRKVNLFLLGENFKLQGTRVIAGDKSLSPNQTDSTTATPSDKADNNPSVATPAPAAEKSGTANATPAPAPSEKPATSADNAATTEPAVRLISDSILEVTLPEDCQTFTKLGPDGEPGEFVSVQVATYFGESQKLHIPLSVDTIPKASAKVDADAKKTADEKVVADAAKAAADAAKVAVTTHEALRHVNRYDWKIPKMTGLIKYGAKNDVQDLMTEADKPIEVLESDQLTPFHPGCAGLRCFVYLVTKDAIGKESRKQLVCDGPPKRPCRTDEIPLTFNTLGTAEAKDLTLKIRDVVKSTMTKSDNVIAIEVEGFLRFNADNLPVLKLEQPLRLDLKEQEKTAPSPELDSTDHSKTSTDTPTPFDDPIQPATVSGIRKSENVFWRPRLITKPIAVDATKQVTSFVHRPKNSR